MNETELEQLRRFVSQKNEALDENHKRILHLEHLVIALSNRNGLSDDQAEAVAEIRRRLIK